MRQDKAVTYINFLDFLLRLRNILGDRSLLIQVSHCVIAPVLCLLDNSGKLSDDTIDILGNLFSADQFVLSSVKLVVDLTRFLFNFF